MINIKKNKIQQYQIILVVGTFFFTTSILLLFQEYTRSMSRRTRSPILTSKISTP